MARSEFVECESRQDVDEILKELESPSRLEMGTYTTGLRFVGVAHGLRAVLKLARESDETGWRDLALSLEYLLGAFRVRTAMKYPNGTWHDTNRACLLFAAALALQSKCVATWLADVMIASYTAGGPLKDWDHTPFETLALRLACSVKGISPIRESARGPYADIYDELLSATDITATQEALSELVIKRVCLVSESYSDAPPFMWPPFDLFPVDILAVLTVNHSGIPKFDFGCLESPLCDPSIPFPYVKDDLVDRVIARVASQFPLTGVAWN